MQQDALGAVAGQVAAQLPLLARQLQLLQPLAAAAAASLIATGPVQHFGSVTLLLNACQVMQQLQELQQQLVDTMCASMRSATAGAFQASNIIGMLPALQAKPGLQQQLQAALADSIFLNALLAAQADASMLRLCPVLLSTSELREKHFGAYAAAVAAHPSRIALLVQLATQQLPGAALQQLIGSASIAVRAVGTSCGITSYGPSLQVADWVLVIDALQHTPALQQQLRRAVAETVCTSGALLLMQTDISMPTVSNQLLQEEQLQAALYKGFAAAVAQRPSNDCLLQQLLQSPAVQQSPAAVECLVAAAADSITSRGGTWQISAPLQVANALKGLPNAQLKVHATIVEAVFSSTALLAAQTDDSILQLSSMLLGAGSLQAAHYDHFAAAVAQRPSSAALLALLLQSSRVAASASAQEQLVTAAAAAIRTRRSTWQVTQEAQLLAALRATPALGKHVGAAIAECVFTQGVLLAAQTGDSMLQLSDMLLGNPQLRAAYYDHFVAAVEQRQDNYQLLKQLLQSGAVRGALAVAEVQQLVACQVANLERLGAVPPFTWHMPQAVVPAGVISSDRVRATCASPWDLALALTVQRLVLFSKIHKGMAAAAACSAAKGGQGLAVHGVPFNRGQSLR
jgi:hypothetical protein